VNYAVGGRVRLRPVEIKDDEYIVRWRNTDRLAFFDQTVVTPDTHRLFVENRKSHDLVWMVEAGSWTVGMVSLTVDVVNATAEFGRLYIAQGFRRQRLGTEASYTALAYGFELLRLQSIWLLARSDNKEVRRMYDNMGWCAELAKLDVIRMTYKNTYWALEGRNRFMRDFGVNLDPHLDTI